MQRKTAFIDELKWWLDASSVIEIDAYDRAEAVYLIEADAPREPVTASARLLPTSAPHLMGDTFAHLCADSPSRPVHRFPGRPRSNPGRASSAGRDCLEEKPLAAPAAANRLGAGNDAARSAARPDHRCLPGGPPG